MELLLLGTLAALVAQSWAGTHGVDTSLASRLDASSARFIGKPYVLSPLGEGPGAKPDSDPMYREDAFDCTTYVETVIAWALAGGDRERARRELTRIRYGGKEPSFENRSHFIEADWIPALLQLGVLEDITARVGQAKILNVAIDRSEIRGLSANTGKAKVSLPYTEAKSLDLALVPNGAIANFVRLGSKRIYHQGIVIRNTSGVWLRHASSGKSRRVIQVSLKSYIDAHQHPIGVNWLAIKPQY